MHWFNLFEGLFTRPEAERALERMIERHTAEEIADGDHRRNELTAELSTVAGEEAERLPALHEAAQKADREAQALESEARKARRAAQLAKLKHSETANVLATRRGKIEGELLRLENPDLRAFWPRFNAARDEIIRRAVPPDWPEGAPYPHPSRATETPPPPDPWRNVDAAAATLVQLEAQLQELAFADSSQVRSALKQIEIRLDALRAQ